MLSLFDRSPVTELHVAHAGEVYRIALRRIAATRRYTLRVRAASRDVLLTMPARGTIKAAREFAERHAAWIGVRLARLPKPVAFQPGESVPLRGVEHAIVHRPERRGVVWLEAGAICVAGDLAHAPRRVADWLKREARRDLEAAVTRHAAAAGVKPRRMSLRDTTSRWGSCSSTGALNFSWRLILAPPYVLDYLAAHEIAHMRHMNHSPMFWALTRRLYPDTDRAEVWLKAHGSSLHRFGAASGAA